MTYKQATTVSVCGYISDCHVEEIIITSIVVVDNNGDIWCPGLTIIDTMTEKVVSPFKSFGVGEN